MEKTDTTLTTFCTSASVLVRAMEKKLVPARIQDDLEGR